jgi:hypothetical protein
MRLPSFARGAAVAAAFAIAFAGTACDSGPDEIRTVADFDAAPCLLFTEDAMRRTVADPYARLAGVEPTLVKSEAADVGQDTRACVYTFEAGGPAQVPQVGQMTVTVAHHRNGSQPLAICVAGAAQRAAGYRLQQIGDQACMTPTSDLWMKVGESYYQVVVVPQPGFDNEVDASLALSPIILTVAEGAASRLPKS